MFNYYPTFIIYINKIALPTMRTFLIFFFFIASKLVLAQITITKNNQRTFILSPNVKSSDYLPNILIVKYKTLIKTDVKTGSLKKIDLKSAHILSIKTKFSNASGFLKQANQVDLQGASNKGHTNDLSLIYELKYLGAVKIEEVINELLQDKNVEYAEPSYVFHPFYTPNDSLLSSQSYLNQVMAPQAWDVIKNSSGVIISIVDNGSDLSHQDLKGNIYLNTADPINGIDDDHDGYIDNYNGWDFVGASSSNIQPDNNPGVKSALSDHGVHVSGLASAVSDNRIGVSSIAFNAKLLIVKAAADDDPENIIKGYEGIIYAADHGAQIINCSWGGISGGRYGQDAINYALNKGCLIVAAAGNSNDSIPVFPAAYKGVLAVANVQDSDVKNFSSSYGSYVSISAPGTNILSTFYNNQYGTLTGTSMSTPIVSSAAALVKSYFPKLTMQQIGERLRVTADNIDKKNPGLAGMIGKGRLNVYKALIESSPSIRNQKITISGNNTLLPGDTILLYADLKDLLDPANDLSVSLATENPFVKIINPQINAGSFISMQAKLIGPFKVYILSTAPDDTNVDFRLSYSANNSTYTDSENFTVQVSLDYINVTVNNISTTMSSNGRVGFSNANTTNGLGFQYKGVNLLNEASLMIGNAPTMVSNNARNYLGSNEDFVKKIRAHRINSITTDFEGKSEFSDSASTHPLNIYIKHRQIAYSKAPDDKFSIVEYKIINRNPTKLTGIYVGLFTDWDIGTNAKDITRYDPFNRLAYQYGRFEKTVYAGVKLLSISAPPAYYPLSDAVQGNPLFNGFVTEDKYHSLSHGIESLSLGENSTNGYNVSFVSGYGPYIVPPHDSITVAFALLAGENLNDLENSALVAQKKYETVLNYNTLLSKLVLNQNYPNPASHNTLIPFSIPSQGHATLTLFNIIGYKIKTLLDSNLQSGNYSLDIDVSGLLPGVYLYKLVFDNMEQTRKMIVTN